MRLFGLRSGERHEDAQLVDRMLAGESSAFDEFSDRLIPGVYRFAASRLRGERELVRDIVQTTVCKVLAKLDSYRGDAALLTWLCACCRNEIAMHHRRSATRGPSISLDDEAERADGILGAVQPESEVRLLRRESAALVHATLDALPEHYSQVLEWKYLDRYSVIGIAERLEMSPKAAESLLTRARKAFRSLYRDLDGTLGNEETLPRRQGSGDGHPRTDSVNRT